MLMLLMCYKFFHPGFFCLCVISVMQAINFAIRLQLVPLLLVELLIWMADYKLEMK